MATLTNVKSKRMYSWWWDSHISPKNSKWLQENLTDMDAKVKQMIKLIEEDADSFARRAEMYYKKRPELMRMVEDFYRAYRALAERYDNATGLIRQAHRTMIEVFPNQVPGEDVPAMVDDPDDLQKDSSVFYGVKKKKSGDRQERRSFNFNDDGEREQEKEIVTLKESLAKLEAEKVAGLFQYQQSLENLSELEKQVVHAQEDSKRHNEQASKAEAEALALAEELTKSKSEREACVAQYQQCMDKIANLEKNLELAQEHNNGLNERANKAETEAEVIKHDLSMMEVEKDGVLAQKIQLLLKIADLENKLLQAEENIRKFSAQADKAESEVASLKQALSKLTKEKEAASHQYQHCLETISILERQLSCAQEEAQRLNNELSDGVSKLKDVEDHCLQLNTSNQSLSNELADLMQKMATQDEELTQKQQELGTFLACVQEERARFSDVESSFKNLQHLHTQSQEELNSLNAELQQRAQVLTELQTRNNDLQVEVQKVKEENFSYTMSTKSMQDELTSLRADREKLEDEVKLRVNERNMLQQDISRLKEEINSLNSKHGVVLEQVNSVGLNVESFGSTVKELQDENSKLHVVCEKEKSEKAGYMEKLVTMEKLLEKNAAMESSVSELREELEAMRVKVKQLENLCQFYLGEKSVLIAEKLTIFSQLQITTENLGKLSEKNAVLENSLVHANQELDGFRENTKRLEESCQFLNTDKSLIIIEKESLSSQLQISQQKLEDMEKKYSELELTYSCLEKEKDATLYEVEKLKAAIEVEKQEHAESFNLSATRLSTLESQLYSLHEQYRNKEKELEEKLEEAVNAQIEIFILQRCVKDLEDEKVEQHAKVKSSLDQINQMRKWMYGVLKALDIDSYHGSDNMTDPDQTQSDRILGKIEGTKSSLLKSMDDNQQLILENLVLCTLLEQMGVMAKNLETEKIIHYQELITRTRESLALQNKNKLLEEEAHGASSEVISLSFLSLIWKSTLNETYAEMRKVCENLDQIRAVCGVLENKVKVMEENLEISGVKNYRLEELLHQKEVECLEAEKKLYVLQNEQTMLQNLLENKKSEFDKVKVIKENHEKQIQTLEAKFLTLDEDHEEGKVMVKTLNSQLDSWEIEGTAFFSELQTSTVYGAILAEKVQEFTETCNALEDKSSYYIKEIELLKARVGTLENKNGRLEAELAASVPAISSLDHSIASLENLIIQRDHDKEVKDDNLDRHLNPSNSGELNGDVYATVPVKFPDLQCLETRIKAIEEVLIETERLAFQQKLNQTRQTESNRGEYSNQRRRTHEISEVGGSEILTKDIVLDQTSECSPYNISKRETTETNDQMLELWETNYRNGSIDLKVGKSPKIAALAEPTLYHEIKAVRRQSSSRNPSSEKDLSFDKFEISRRFSETRQDGGNKRSIFDRLASDTQKLTNLQITVHDLKKMVEITEKNKKGKGNIEFSNVKEQLEESEDAILKLFDIYQTLVNKAEEKSGTDTEESSYIRKRLVSEQARKGSEKIGRLQLEVQKLQFLLLKLDGEKEKSKAKARASERRRVILRDYLYGGIIRPSQRKKKASFCACVRSPTKDD